MFFSYYAFFLICQEFRMAAFFDFTSTALFLHIDKTNPPTQPLSHH